MTLKAYTVYQDESGNLFYATPLKTQQGQSYVRQENVPFAQNVTAQNVQVESVPMQNHASGTMSPDRTMEAYAALAKRNMNGMTHSLSGMDTTANTRSALPDAFQDAPVMNTSMVNENDALLLNMARALVRLAGENASGISSLGEQPAEKSASSILGELIMPDGEDPALKYTE